MNEDIKWDNFVAPIYAQRRAIAAELEDVLMRAREEGCTPLSISLAIVDIVKMYDGKVLISLTRGNSACASRILAHYLGDVRPSQIEAWGQSGENGFPPPSEGSSSRDWMWTVGDVYDWLRSRR